MTPARPETHADAFGAEAEAAAGRLDASIPRRVDEAAYLTAPNADRYRVIVHFFYRQYVEQRDWLTAEHVWRYVREKFDSAYTVERCEDDLRALVAWRNLLSEQDRSRVSSLDEWHHRNQVYHITVVTVELEAALERLRQSHGQRGSLDSSLVEMLVTTLTELDRVFVDGVASEPPKDFVAAKVRRPWMEAYARFDELRTNANRFHHTLRETRPEDLSDADAFFRYKDVLLENLAGFIVELGDAIEHIREILYRWERHGFLDRLVGLLTAYDLRYQADPRGPADPGGVRAHHLAQVQVVHEWFRHRGGSDVLRRTTMAAIETVARHTQRLTDPRRLGSNRRRDLERLVEALRACETLDHAHLLAIRTLGCATARHLTGAAEWHLMGDGASVWAQPPSRIALAPVRRGPRRARSGQPVPDRSVEQAALLEREQARIRAETVRWDRLFGQGEIDVGALTLDDPAIRDRILEVLGDCLSAPDGVGIASDGGRVRLLKPADVEEGELVAPDGVLLTPRYRLRREAPGGPS